MKMNSLTLIQDVAQVGPRPARRRAVVRADAESRRLRCRGTRSAVRQPRRSVGGRRRRPRYIRATRSLGVASSAASTRSAQRLGLLERRTGRSAGSAPGPGRSRRCAGRSSMNGGGQSKASSIGVEEVPADVEVDAPPAVAVERAAGRRPAAAVHERRQVDRDAAGRTVGRSSRPETARIASRIASASSRRTLASGAAAGSPGRAASASASARGWPSGRCCVRTSARISRLIDQPSRTNRSAR